MCLYKTVNDNFHIIVILVFKNNISIKQYDDGFNFLSIESYWILRAILVLLIKNKALNLQPWYN